MTVLAEKLKFEDVTELTLKPGIINLGRAGDNDIKLSDPDCADYHAQILTYFHQSFLIDLSGSAGSYLNGKTIIKHSLSPGDLITLGQHTFKVTSPQCSKTFETIYSRNKATGMVSR